MKFPDFLDKDDLDIFRKECALSGLRFTAHSCDSWGIAKYWIRPIDYENRRVVQYRFNKEKRVYEREDVDW